MTDSRWCRSCLATVKKKKKKDAARVSGCAGFLKIKSSDALLKCFLCGRAPGITLMDLILTKNKKTHNSLSFGGIYLIAIACVGSSAYLAFLCIETKKARFVYYWVCFFRGKWELCHIQRSARATAYSVQEYIAFLGKYLCLLCV